MPLCYLTEYPWASTETRKIVKGEERIVHFLDAKQTVRQTRWGHHFSDACNACSVREICGGLFDRGGGYDAAELYPIFLNRDDIAKQIIYDGSDPSWSNRPFSEWKEGFELRLEEARLHAQMDDGHDEPEGTDGHPTLEPNTEGSVGFVDEKGMRIFEKRRKAEGKMAERRGVTMENTEVALGDRNQNVSRPWTWKPNTATNTCRKLRSLRFLVRNTIKSSSSLGMCATTGVCFV